ncbi:hypothetical protein Mapa_011394 [Marchantia paleacea]|nr:hypothetical protein Mapa_011394 [Marchantia paleacea]
MMAPASCDLNGFSFVSLVAGALNYELCSLPALLGVVQLAFGIFLVLKIIIQGKNENTLSRSPPRLLSTVHGFFTWLSGLLCLLLLAALIAPLCLWRQSNYHHFPLEELLVICFQAFGWFVTFVGLNREETHERPLYETTFRVWHTVALVVSLPGSTITLLHSFSFTVDMVLAVVPGVLFLLFVSGHATALIYKKNYNWGLRSTDASLKQPLLEEITDEHPPDLSGYSKAGLPSRLVFAWIDGVLASGYRRPLEREDLPPMSWEDDAAYNSTLFSAQWEKLKRETPAGVPPSLWSAVIRTYWVGFLVPVVATLLWTVAFFVGPLMLYFIIDYLNRDSDQRVLWQGILFVIIMFAGKFLEPFAKQQMIFQSFKLGVQMWSGVGSAVYHKSLRLSNKAKQKWSVGEITNLISSDMQKFLQLNLALAQCLVLPLQLVVAAGILFWVVGISMIAGLSTLLIVISLNVFLVAMMRKYRINFLKAKDERMKVTVECLSNMKVIKLQSWDTLFTEKIEALRAIEVNWVAKFMYTWACSIFAIWGAPVAVSIVTFFTMVWLGDPLDAGKVFTALTTFSVIKEPVQQFPDNVSNVIQMMVSIGRMRVFLCEDELDDKAVDRVQDCDSEYAVDIERASFTWDSDSDVLAVRDLTLQIPKGSCIAVCGGVGSGKSSLLYCIMGELQKLTGSAKLCGRVAYVAQSAWIQTKSVRDNILFGRPMDSKMYAEAIRAAGLETDLAQMPHGDKTEIGERGINMSGGQKQRIQLARAVYSDADVYLLDDPFSAVDAHTASHLFQECVRGALRNKAVVLVTHQVEFLQATDRILVMKDGAVVQSGRYEELVREGREFGAFVDALQDALQSVNQVKEDASANSDAITPLEKTKSMTKTVSLKKSNSKSTNEGDGEEDDFIQKEERRIGGIKAGLVWTYATRTFGGVFFFIVIALNVAAYGLQVAGDSWLAGGVRNQKQLSYVAIYAVLTTGGVVAVLLRSLSAAFWGTATAQAFYLTMIRNIMRAPMAFFDSTPLGRIISRSSSDQAALEIDLPNALALCIFNIVGMIGSVTVTSYVTPQLLFLVIPLGMFLLKLRMYFITSTREIVRVLQVCEAPVFLHVGETVAGITTIRAFQEQKWFASINAERFEDYQRCYFHFQSLVCWFSFRLQMICALMVSAVAFLLILLPPDILGAGMAGLALTYALGVNSVLGGLMYNFAIAEGKLVSVERISQYSDLPTEAPLVIENHRPAIEWPNEGKIELQNLQFRYRPSAPLVLKGITCVLESKEKVGVVGRTGSGKSTLIQALFRLVEPSGGRILIDGLDISTIGLSDLRTRLSVIPQEPTIFEGSLRTNLDPFNKHSDQEIWETLEKCLLAESVRVKPEKLNASVSQAGENWSVGERQLLCLGRALLTKAKILVLDEATASVDITTDGIIQRTIREHFGECTVISVAHRIPSVIDSDRVLVLDAGYLKENGSPDRLLSDKNSLFSKLVYEYTDRTGVNHE